MKNRNLLMNQLTGLHNPEFPPKFNVQKKKSRVGRGIGSNKGKTCGRGHKGQKSRVGYSRNYAFEGGQTSLFKRIPKSGFTSKKNIHSEELTINKLDILPKDIQSVNLEILKTYSLIKKSTQKVKLILKDRIAIPRKVVCENISCSTSVKNLLLPS